MATRTKPFRIFEADVNAISQLATVHGSSGAELVHEALQEYLVNHRTEFEAAFTATQQALATGDFERLGEIAARARGTQVDAIMDDLPA